MLRLSARYRRLPVNDNRHKQGVPECDGVLGKDRTRGLPSPRARSAARRFADRWAADYPRAVACLRDDLDELLTCWRYNSLSQHKAVRTTNAIERRSREVRRRTRPMGVFSDRTSMDRILFAVFNHENRNHRILFAVFNHENRNQGVSTPLLLTQTF